MVEVVLTWLPTVDVPGDDVVACVATEEVEGLRIPPLEAWEYALDPAGWKVEYEAEEERELPLD